MDLDTAPMHNMTPSSEGWVLEHIQQLDFAGLNSVAKTIGTASDENTGTKIALLKVVLRFLSSSDIETSEGSNIFKHIQAFIHKNYKMTPVSSSNYHENLLIEKKQWI